MKAIKRVGTIIISVLLWLVILVAALYAFTTMATKDNQNVANLFGYTPLVVESNSMSPTFKKDDLIFVKKCDTSKLEEGDIICFHTIIDNEYALNTHRIQSIAENGEARSYTTVGDNNNGVADQHIISDGDIVGKYVGHISGAGKLMNFLSSSTGFLLVIVLPMLIFFIYQVYNLIMISIRLKKAVAVENAREQTEAEIALEEAKRLRDEAEAMRAKAEEELKNIILAQTGKSVELKMVVAKEHNHTNLAKVTVDQALRENIHMDVVVEEDPDDAEE